MGLPHVSKDRQPHLHRLVVQRHTRVYRLRVKVLEAKYLLDPGLDYYCGVRVDNQHTVGTTQAVSNESNPFWAEEFEYESEKGFLNVHCTVWGEDRGLNSVPVPIGKAIIPRREVKSEEVWYMLKDASFDAKVHGAVHIQIKHFPPKIPRKVHGFSVTILRAKNLSRQTDTGKSKASSVEAPNPFAVLHLLPDPEAITTQHTYTQRCTNDPNFNEMFFFTCNASQDVYARSLHVSIWNQDITTDYPPGFLGHVTIPLGPIIQKKSVSRFYNLTALVDDSEVVLKKKKSSEEDRRNRPREFVKSLQSTVRSTSHKQKQHNFIDKVVVSTCLHCSTMMVGTQSYCVDCKLTIHTKCTELVTPTCGGVGGIRLKMDIGKITVLDTASYVVVKDILREEEFKILSVLGKFSSAREEAAKYMIRILDSEDDSLLFVKTMVYQEIMASEDPKTLFRANSMASKALDVYMKFVGTGGFGSLIIDYLRGVLEDVLKHLVYSKKTFEIDPLRMEKDKKRDTRFIAEETVAGNADNLKEMNITVTDCIFASANRMPKKLKIIFELIQETVNTKFPGQDLVRYTAVSGFIFLRFFAPAILGPTLFGLKVGVLDQSSTRKLLLVAKTLQNLSNLVEFGQKEPFMEPMNSFINSKIGDMKNFLDSISKTTAMDPSSKSIAELKALASRTATDVNKDCADLCNILTASMDKLTAAFPPNSDLLKRLSDALHAINSQVKDIESKEANSPIDYWNDIGIDVESPGKSDEGEEDKKLLRMLSRCPSHEDIDSPLSPVSIGCYKTSSELKDQLVKGSVIATVQLPKAPIVFMDPSHAVGVESYTEVIEEVVAKEPPRLSELPFQTASDPVDYLEMIKSDPLKEISTASKKEPQFLNGVLPKIRATTNRKKEKEPIFEKDNIERSSIVSFSKQCKDMEDTATLDSRSSINNRDIGSSPNIAFTHEKVASNIFKELLSRDSKSIFKNSKAKEEVSGRSSKDSLHVTSPKPVLPALKIGSAEDLQLEDDTEGYINPFAPASSVKSPETAKPPQTPLLPSSPPAGGFSFMAPISTRARRPSLLAAFQGMNGGGDSSPSSRSDRTYSTGASETPTELLSRTASASKGNRMSNIFSHKKKSEKGVSPLASQTICPRCKQDASDPANQAIVDQKKYHQTCLSCFHCKMKLTDEAYIWKDDIVCPRDYFFLSGFTCSVCDGSITGNYVTVGGKRAHAACRPCSLCQQPLNGKEYSVIGDAIFCSEHKDIVPCFACQKKIEGSVLEAHGRFYHPNHFLCTNCGKDLNGCVNYEMEERNYCQWCYMSADPKEEVAAKSLQEAIRPQKTEIVIEKLVSAHTKDPALLNAPPVKQRKQSLLAFLHG